jgi:Ca-activated chloride channel family protein
MSVPVVVALFVWALRLRRRALEQFAESHLLPILIPDVDHRRQYWRAGLLAAALAFLIIAVAGPRWGFQWEEVRREGVDIVIALDTSRSMLATDVKPSRLERAKLALQELVQQLQGDRIGLVAFAGSAFIQCPLTLDYGAFLESLQATSVGIIPKGGTALDEAIRTGLAAFENHPSKHHALIIITDGEDHDGQVQVASQLAAEKGIKVYTIGVGTPEGELISLTIDGRPAFLKDRQGQVVKSRLDTETLQDIAITTGGAYVYDSSPSLGLDEVYTRYISQLEKRELTSTLERRYEDRFQLPLALGLILLVLEPFIRDQRRADSRVQWSQLLSWRKSR